MGGVDRQPPASEAVSLGDGVIAPEAPNARRPVMRPDGTHANGLWEFAASHATNSNDEGDENLIVREMIEDREIG